jgi:ubiquinone/menaquinone biosynthesis C-methylase UbiE
MKRVNIGCGRTPVAGYYNYDNSFSLILSKHPFITIFLEKIGLLTKGQKEYINFAKDNKIFYGDGTKKLPLPNNSVSVVYTSHMVEHLDQSEVKLFIIEVRRILTKNGILRIAIPDLKKLVEKYIMDGDADDFIEKTGFARTPPKSLFAKIKYLIAADRGHKWMYDGPSMVKLLSSAGFKDAKIMPAGTTMISDPGELDLWERLEESVYIEAVNS